MMAGHSLCEVTAFVTSAAVGMAQVASSPWWAMLYPLSYALINYLELFRGEIEIPDDISEHRVMGVCPALVYVKCPDGQSGWIGERTAWLSAQYSRSSITVGILE